MLRSGLVGLVDVELSDGPQFFEPIVNTAHRHDANVIASFHDFDKTPSNETLLGTIAEMVDPEIARDHFALALFRQDASEKPRHSFWRNLSLRNGNDWDSGTAPARWSQLSAY